MDGCDNGKASQGQDDRQGSSSSFEQLEKLGEGTYATVRSCVPRLVNTRREPNAPPHSKCSMTSELTGTGAKLASS